MQPRMAHCWLGIVTLFATAGGAAELTLQQPSALLIVVDEAPQATDEAAPPANDVFNLGPITDANGAADVEHDSSEPQSAEPELVDEHSGAAEAAIPLKEAADPDAQVGSETETSDEDATDEQPAATQSDDSAPAAVPPPPAVLVRRSPLHRLVQSVLDEYYRAPLNTRDDSPWSVLHWSIAYGVDAKVAVGKPNGQQVTAIGWLCCNYPAAGKQMIDVRNGKWDLEIAPGRQGHDAQFLSMLAQSRVNRNYLLRVGGQEETVEQLIEYEKRTCRRGQELTFKLTALSHYEGTEAKWKNARGESWSVTNLLEEELAAPVGRYEATCGGLHRLFAINYAVDRRLREGLPIDGPYRAAQQKTQQYQQRAFRLQNRDGSFSTAWLDNAENRGDDTRRLTTSGHVLEWLVFSLPEEQLDDPRLLRGVQYIAQLLKGRSQEDWHPGAMGHALHALSIYEQRTLGVEPGQRSLRLAKGDTQTQRE